MLIWMELSGERVKFWSPSSSSSSLNHCPKVEVKYEKEDQKKGAEEEKEAWGWNMRERFEHDDSWGEKRRLNCDYHLSYSCFFKPSFIQILLNHSDVYDDENPFAFLSALMQHTWLSESHLPSIPDVNLMTLLPSTPASPLISLFFSIQFSHHLVIIAWFESDVVSWFVFLSLFFLKNNHDSISRILVSVTWC